MEPITLVVVTANSYGSVESIPCRGFFGVWEDHLNESTRPNTRPETYNFTLAAEMTPDLDTYPRLPGYSESKTRTISLTL